MLTRADEMFQAQAYLHQYVKHGVEEEFFEESFIKVEQVVMNYKKLDIFR